MKKFETGKLVQELFSCQPKKGRPNIVTEDMRNYINKIVEQKNGYVTRRSIRDELILVKPDLKGLSDKNIANIIYN